jgi:methionyl-tRNA synthetase
MGKDNVPFHTLSFPATILGSGEPWKLVDPEVVQLADLLRRQVLDLGPPRRVHVRRPGAAARRLLALVPDGERSGVGRLELHLAAVPAAVNKDLVGTFGNLVNRTVSQVTRHYDDVVPTGGEPAAEEAVLVEKAGARLAEYLQNLHDLEFRKAANSLRALWAEGNLYLESREPWKSIKVDRERTACTLRTALGFVVACAVASEPFVPGATARLRDAFPAVDWGSLVLDADLLERAALDPGGEVRPPGLLFQKLDEEQLAAWAEHFGGSEVTT